jgi:hypothetical protein
MAFKNFIKEGSYTIIDNVSYSKEGRDLSFSIKCFEDSKKKFVILDHKVKFNFDNKLTVIDEYFTSIKQLDEDKLSFILSPAEDNGFFTKRKQERVEADGSKNVEDIVEKGNTPEYIFITDINSYMKYNSDTKRYEKDTGLTTIHFWDNNLAPDKLRKYDNPLELAYTFGYKYVDILKGLVRD